MKRISARLLILTLFAATLMIAGAAYANGRGMHHRGMKRAEVRKLIASLNITDAQEAQMKAVADKYQPTVKPMFKNLMAERKKLGAMINADKIDDAAIRAQVGKISSIGADLAVKRAHELVELKAVLTPEQIRKVKESKIKKPGFLLMQIARHAKKG
ncbi:MAG: Spy/CpxP family protein refolding chaperone [Nitrospirota bacterium]